MWHFIWAGLIRVCSFPFSIMCWPEGFQRRPQHRFGCFSRGTERAKALSIRIDVRVQFHQCPVTGPCFGQYQSGWTYEPQLFLWLSRHVMFPVFFLSINLSQNMFLARDGNGKINKRCWAICLTQKKRTRGCWNSLWRSKRVNNGNTEIAPARLTAQLVWCTVAVTLLIFVVSITKWSSDRDLLWVHLNSVKQTGSGVQNRCAVLCAAGLLKIVWSSS